MTVLSIFKNKNNTNNNNKITLKTTTTTCARAISKIHTTFLLSRFLRWWCATGSRTPFSSSVRLAWPTARSDRALILVILLFAYFVALLQKRHKRLQKILDLLHFPRASVRARMGDREIAFSLARMCVRTYL